MNVAVLNPASQPSLERTHKASENAAVQPASTLAEHGHV
jgi:hypothetical protein